MFKVQKQQQQQQQKKTERKNPKLVKTKNGKMMLLSKCAVWNNKKLRFNKEQEANGL